MSVFSCPTNYMATALNMRNEENQKNITDLENSLTSMDWLPRLNVRAISEAARSEDKDMSRGKATTDGDGTENQTKDGKPPFSYANLITLAINSSDKKKMTLSEIYYWICENYPFYKTAGNGWKNSIRHNLSLNKCFMKVPRSKDDPGKGSYWAVDNRPNDELFGARGVKRRRLLEDNSEGGYYEESPYSNSSESLSSSNSLRPPHIQLPTPAVMSSSPQQRSPLHPCLSSTPLSQAPFSPNHQMGGEHLSASDGFENLDLGDLSESFRSIYQTVFQPTIQQEVNVMTSPRDAMTSPGDPMNASRTSSTVNQLSNSQSSDIYSSSSSSSASNSYNHHHYRHHQQPDSSANTTDSRSCNTNDSGVVNLNLSDSFFSPNHHHGNHHLPGNHDMTLNQINKTTNPNHSSSASGLIFDWCNSMDSLRSSCARVKSYNWSGVDFTQFQDLVDNMIQADQKNWNLDQQSAVDLCGSLNRFFQQTGFAPHPHHHFHSPSASRGSSSMHQHHLPHPSHHVTGGDHNNHPPPHYSNHQHIPVGGSERSVGMSSNNLRHPMHPPPPAAHRAYQQHHSQQPAAVTTAAPPPAHTSSADHDEIYDNFDWDSIC